MVSASIMGIAPIITNFVVPQNEGNDVVQEYGERILDVVEYNDETFSYKEYDKFFFKNLIVSQKTNTDSQTIKIEFENEQKMPMTFEVQSYTPYRKGNRKGIKTGTSAPSKIFQTEIQEGKHHFEFDVDFTSAWRVRGEGKRIDFVNDYDLFSPTYKYQLKRSELNTNKVNNDLYKKKKELNNEMFPAFSGKLDLIIDFRNPEIHNNEHIKKKEWSKPLEFFDMKKWGANLTIDISAPDNYVEIFTAEVDEIMESTYYDKWVKDLETLESHTYNFSGIYQQGIPVDNIEFVVEDDGYGYLLIKEIIDVPEDRAVVRKVEKQEDMFLKTENKIYEPVEGGSTNNNGTWFTKRDTDRAPEYFIYHERGKTYYDFHFLNPWQTTLLISGVITLFLGLFYMFKINANKEK